MNSDLVFKALADEHRRKLLDLLSVRDGLSLKSLEAHLPMTRFGCMKHLKVLEDAGLVTTRKVGREKLHYLNPVPIQLVYERWVSKYAQPFARQLTLLKSHLEVTMSPPSHVQQIFIRTSAEKLWSALTESEYTVQYYFGNAVESDWKSGSAYRYRDLSGLIVQGGGTMIQGTVLESDPPRRLVMTFEPVWLFPDGHAPASKVTYEIEPSGELCRLTLIHEGLEPDARMTQNFIAGWTRVLSGMKTLLETGRPLESARAM
jgi:uncharacterized protein YndB with AHSA1/START domain